MPGGGLNSRVRNWPTAVVNFFDGLKDEYRCSVSRDFVRNCATSILVMPDDVPAHPFQVCEKSAPA